MDSRILTSSPALLAAEAALRAGEVAKAQEHILAHLSIQPKDAAALRLLAGAAMATGRTGDAERWSRRAIALAPGFILAHVDLVAHLSRIGRGAEAVALLEPIIADQPEAVWALSLKAAVLDVERRTDETLAVHEAVLAQAPDAALPWRNYGLALKAVGRTKDAIAAYRKSLALDPDSGAAWWGLANLRTVHFEAGEVSLMEKALKGAGDNLDRAQLHFALAKALGDQGRFESSFQNYEKANEVRATIVPYDPVLMRDFCRGIVEQLTPQLFQRRSNYGCDSPDAIFIVGMPRSGSTLVEQILASHPLIEGLGELFELQQIADQIASRAPTASWGEAFARLNADEAAAFGRSYLDSVRRYRRTDRPFFTDKMPSNWRYTGLIQLILPRARIIDVRRHPMACCFSCFSTYFNRQTSFPTSLADLANYYRSYAGVIDHFEMLLPGRIHRVRYERLVENQETEVRNLLTYLDLPFEEACLRAHENPRAIYTPSAQQVRTPINRNGLEHWRQYAPWLTPLESAFGSISEDYAELR